MLILLVTCLVVMLVEPARGFPSLMNKIPNGHNVLNPCDGTAWHGVGHQNPSGGGTLNPFGADFHAAGLQWTTDVCHQDSDGDGMSNGAELGDSSCTWTAGDPVPAAVRGHPGICEPTDSAACTNINSWLQCGPPVG